MVKNRFTIASLLVTGLLFLAGCDANALATLIPQATQTPAAATHTPPAITPTTEKEITPSPTTPGPQVLTIWVPPQFNPQAGTPGGTLFQQRLDAFVAENPNVQIQVRVKAISGPGGLLESLSAASSAAPGALPSLIALPRTDLESAALRGLVFPLDELTGFQENSDWYPYARQLAEIQESSFGLPFGGDALILMYRPEKVGAAPTNWNDILRLGQPVVFPAADPQALVSMTLYRSAGGPTQDDQQRPLLVPENLGEVLRLYSEGARLGAFPAWLTQYQTDGQAWQAYHEARGNMVISWSSRYLADLPIDTAAVPLPSLGSQDYTMAAGWMWAIAEPQGEQQTLAAQLAQFLVESEYLGRWTAAAGYLPTRPSSLEAWKDQGLKTIVSRIVLSAEVRPTNDLIASTGPVLQEAVTQVVKSQVDPIQAAQAASENLNSQ